MENIEGGGALPPHVPTTVLATFLFIPISPSHTFVGYITKLICCIMYIHKQKVNRNQLESNISNRCQDLTI